MHVIPAADCAPSPDAPVGAAHLAPAEPRARGKTSETNDNESDSRDVPASSPLSFVSKVSTVLHAKNMTLETNDNESDERDLPARSPLSFVSKVMFSLSNHCLIHAAVAQARRFDERHLRDVLHADNYEVRSHGLQPPSLWIIPTAAAG